MAYGALDLGGGTPPPRETTRAAYGARDKTTYYGAKDWDTAAYGSLDPGGRERLEGAPLLGPATIRLVG